MRLSFLLLAGCPMVTETFYDENIRDVDGDGFVSTRFGGPDCRDMDPSVTQCDADGDGVFAIEAGGTDCDDQDATIHPDAVETCDSIDNDCDGLVDNADPSVDGPIAWYEDRDADGTGAIDRGFVCQVYLDPANPSTGLYVPDPTDCNDNDATVGPHASERCDGFDNDCDGVVDDAGTWFLDADGDGYGADGTQAVGPCILEGTAGIAATDGDCDDQDPDVSPGAEEVPYDGVDANCNGDRDDWDPDFDGHVVTEHWSAAQAANALLPPDQRWVIVEGDCDDLDARVFDGGEEVCDGVDNDCDGLVDVEDLVGALPTDELALRAEVTTWYIDADGDGGPGTPVEICPQDVDPALHHLTGDDCFDGGVPPEGMEGAAPTDVHAGREESCDGFDNDCDGVVDQAFVPFEGSLSVFLDADGDGYGFAERFACAASGDLVLLGDDCNDAAPGVFPGAPEICGDALRQDCSDADIFDCDGDGVQGDYLGGGDGADCDDEDPDVHPSVAVEVCDGIDNDCDGLVDSADLDNLDARDEPFWYVDADGDGYGVDDGTGLQQCDQPEGRSVLAGDCNDLDASLSPGTIWYIDADNDGYGDSDTAFAQCARPAANAVFLGGDCDDTDVNLRPGTVWSLDSDRDGAGAIGTDEVFCSPPDDGNWVRGVGADCADEDPDRHPLVLEVIGDGVDNNCDGIIDADADVLWYVDEDGDGFGTGPGFLDWQPGMAPNDGDCDDTSAAINPAVPVELCDGLDNNCDGFSLRGIRIDADGVETVIDEVDVSNPWSGVIIPGDAQSVFLAANTDGLFSAGLVVTSCSELAGGLLERPDAADVNLLPIDDGVDPLDFPNCPDGGTGTLYANDADGDGVPGLSSPTDLHLDGCGEAVPLGYLPVLDAFDCAPNDASLSVPVVAGTYGDVDGDGVFAGWTEVGACAARVQDTPGADCDDHDPFASDRSASAPLDIPDDVLLDDVLAACDHAELVLTDDHTVGLQALMAEPSDGYLVFRGQHWNALVLGVARDGDDVPDPLLDGLSGHVELRDLEVHTELFDGEVLPVEGRLELENVDWHGGALDLTTGSIGIRYGQVEPRTAEPWLAVGPGTSVFIEDTFVDGGATFADVQGELDVQRSTLQTMTVGVRVSGGAFTADDLAFEAVENPVVHDLPDSFTALENTSAKSATAFMVFAGTFRCTGCSLEGDIGVLQVLDASVSLDDSVVRTRLGSAVLLENGGSLFGEDVLLEGHGRVVDASSGELELERSVVDQQGGFDSALVVGGRLRLVDVDVIAGASQVGLELVTNDVALDRVRITEATTGIELDATDGGRVTATDVQIEDSNGSGVGVELVNGHLDANGLTLDNTFATAVEVRAGQADLRDLQADRPAIGLDQQAGIVALVGGELDATDVGIQATGGTLFVEDARVFADAGHALDVRDAFVAVERTIVGRTGDGTVVYVQDSPAAFDRVTVLAQDGGLNGDPILNVQNNGPSYPFAGQQLLLWSTDATQDPLACLTDADVPQMLVTSATPSCFVAGQVYRSGPDALDPAFDPSGEATTPTVRTFFGADALSTTYPFAPN